jgi:hypothetical protein
MSNRRDLAVTLAHRSSLSRAPQWHNYSSKHVSPSFRRLRSTPCSTRPFSNSIPRSSKSLSSNLLLYFSGTGILGLATYVLGGSAASFSTLPGAHYEAKAREVRTGPGTFPRPKAIEPYKHNISRFVSESPDGGAAVSSRRHAHV